MKKKYFDALYEITTCVPEELGEIAFKITHKEISNDDAAILIAYAAVLIESVREAVHAEKYFLDIDRDRIASGRRLDATLSAAIKTIGDEYGHDHVFHAIEKMVNLIGTK